jgi:hypothetical protein
VTSFCKSNIDRQSGKLTIRAGKGREARTVYLEALTALLSWLRWRGMGDGALFNPVPKSAARFR